MLAAVIIHITTLNNTIICIQNLIIGIISSYEFRFAYAFSMRLARLGSSWLGWAGLGLAYVSQAFPAVYGAQAHVVRRLRR